MTDHTENKKEKDALTGVETTGHEWDGLKELNNPAPRWWLWLFYVTIIWSIGYWVVYPSWPTIQNATVGKFGWTQYKQLAQSQSEIHARQVKYLDRFKSASFDDIRNDPELFEFARRGGEVAFKNNCAACHGTGAAGGRGYPNLNDDDWIWGGTVDDIYATIKYGIRSGHDNARFSMMPAFGTEGTLKAGELMAVANHVLSLSGKGEADAKGAEIFAQHCASCHGAEGQGDRAVGAPRLNDAIWLYGSDREAVINTVSRARNSVMPQWEDKLNETTIRQIALYVHSLGGGE